MCLVCLGKKWENLGWVQARRQKLNNFTNIRDRGVGGKDIS